MKKTTNQDSNQKPKAKKLFPFMNDIKSFTSWNKYKLTEKEAEMYAQAILEWSVNDESWDLLSFYNEIGVLKRTFDAWRIKYPLLDDAVQLVKQRLGERRQRKATFKENEVNIQMVMPTLRFYHPDWQKELDDDKKFKTDLKAIGNDEEKNPVQVVVVKDFPKE